MVLTTADGFSLVITPKGMGRMATGLRRALPGQQHDAVTAIVPQVVGRARLAKVHFQTDSGRDFPVFRSSLNGRCVDIIGRPIGRGLHDVVAAYASMPDREQESGSVKNRVHAHIAWTAPLSLDEATKTPHKRIIYIVERPSGKPVYVGMSRKTFAARWDERLETLRQMGLSHKIRIRIGRISPDNIQTGHLKDVEHAVIRAIYNNTLGGPPEVPQGLGTPGEKFRKWRGDILTNVSSFLPFRVGPGGLNITQDNRPPYLRIRIAREPGKYFELDQMHPSASYRAP